MRKTPSCLSCRTKECELSSYGTFDICKYGISYFNRNGVIEAKEPLVSLSSISKNLRHELNPLLQSIVQNVTEVDNTLSTKFIDKSNPLSRVVAATVIIDNFVQMITGVHDYHTSNTSTSNSPLDLRSVIDYTFHAYGLIKERGRARELIYRNLITGNYTLVLNQDVVKNMIIILIDNAWKHSIDNSVFTVVINHISDGRYKIIFSNKSHIIPENIDIFSLGIKTKADSKGFGYGLYWLKSLESTYNILIDSYDNNQLKINHTQQILTDKTAIQTFEIYNVILSR